jgi:CheY-like chemotaxis protein
VPKNISRILLLASTPDQLTTTLNAVSRTGAVVILAKDGDDFRRELLQAAPHELPELIIMQLNYRQKDCPLDLFREIRNKPATQTVPIILLVETAIEKVMVENLDLPRCFCAVAPFSFGSLVFALPFLEIEIKDSLLYPMSPAGENENRRNAERGSFAASASAGRV